MDKYHDTISPKEVELQTLKYDNRNLEFYIPKGEYATNIQVLHNLPVGCHKAIAFTTPSALYVYVERLRFRIRKNSKAVIPTSLQDYQTYLTVRKGFLKNKGLRFAHSTTSADEKAFLVQRRAYQLLPYQDDKNLGVLLLGEKDRDLVHEIPTIIKPPLELEFQCSTKEEQLEHILLTEQSGSKALSKIQKILETQYITEDWRNIDIGIPKSLIKTGIEPFSKCKNDAGYPTYTYGGFKESTSAIDDFISCFQSFYFQLQEAIKN